MAARKVTLYFDDQKDALRFALAAGSVMSGEQQERSADELIQETQRANRIKLGDAFNPASSHPSRETSAAS
ncbi:MAG TPA: hypothetical protein VEV41_09715 [Terriglobales bacterium]|jgi:hypothetical protein|nr:hypothetical protein [Terriglobales bacterium]